MDRPRSLSIRPILQTIIANNEKVRQLIYFSIFFLYFAKSAKSMTIAYYSVQSIRRAEAVYKLLAW